MQTMGPNIESGDHCARSLAYVCMDNVHAAEEPSSPGDGHSGWTPQLAKKKNAPKTYASNEAKPSSLKRTEVACHKFGYIIWDEPSIHRWSS